MNTEPWQLRAACCGFPDDYWTPQHLPGRPPAVEVYWQALRLIDTHCHACPVRAECWVFCVEHDEAGVYGGRLRAPDGTVHEEADMRAKLRWPPGRAS